MKFEIGDFVCLNGFDVRMIVEDIDYDIVKKKPIVRCSYYDNNNTLVNCSFFAELLRHFGKGEQ